MVEKLGLMVINGDYIRVINVIIYSPVVKHGWEIPGNQGFPIAESLKIGLKISQNRGDLRAPRICGGLHPCTKRADQGY